MAKPASEPTASFCFFFSSLGKKDCAEPHPLVLLRFDGRNSGLLQVACYARSLVRTARGTTGFSEHSIRSSDVGFSLPFLPFPEIRIRKTISYFGTMLREIYHVRVYQERASGGAEFTRKVTRAD